MSEYANKRQQFEDFRVNSPYYHAYSPEHHFDKLAPGMNQVKFRLSVMPWFPRKIVWVNRKARLRSVMERVYLTCSDARGSKCGLVWVSFVSLTILLNCVVFIWQTSPDYQVYPEGCDQCAPVSSDQFLNETAQSIRAALKDECLKCEPVPSSFFAHAEIVFITFFTMEYALRFFSVPFAFSAVEAAQGHEFASHKHRRRLQIFFFDPVSIVDFISIFPFWASDFIGGATNFSVFRILRLFRVFRIFRLGKLSRGVFLFAQVFRKSIMSFTVFLLFSVFGIVVFASLGYYAERGTWDPKTGLYMRDAALPFESKEISPFTGIPTTFWWIVVTFTTVGYGDMVTHTPVGKAIASVAMYTGIVLIAMPVTIMANNLSDVYEEQKRQWRRERKIRSIGATILHHILIGSSLMPLRRSWNKWREVVREQMELEKSLPRLIRNELKHVLHSTKTDQGQAHPNPGQFPRSPTRSISEISLGQESVMYPEDEGELEELLAESQQMKAELQRLKSDVQSQLELILACVRARSGPVPEGKPV
eukprot:c18019_g1_i1.p1 GENE.c18019_g1_i1~~c18019_g1_i1.p1  ORF type:complete len:567 (+),score=102.05 c18019_g1_i1:105-1703(+)